MDFYTSPAFSNMTDISFEGMCGYENICGASCPQCKVVDGDEKCEGMTEAIKIAFPPDIVFL